MCWPSKLPAGSTFTDAVAVEDVLPTLLAAAGLAVDYPKPLDGRDVWPALSSGAPLGPRPMLLVRRGIADSAYRFAYFQDDWKLVQQYDRESQAFHHQLFRILDDPYETEDLAEQYPKVVTEIMGAFEALPKGRMHGMDSAPLPTRRGPGGPGSALPDDGPPRRPPYAESEWQATP